MTIGLTISGTYNTSKGQTTDLMLVLQEANNNGDESSGNLNLGVIYHAYMNRASRDADKNDIVQGTIWIDGTTDGFDMRDSITIAEGTEATPTEIYNQCQLALQARGLTVTQETDT